MKILRAELFVTIARSLGWSIGYIGGFDLLNRSMTKLDREWQPLKPQDVPLGNTIPTEIYQALEKEILEVGLPMSARTVHKMSERASQTATLAQYEEDSKELLGRLEDEMQSKVFFSLESARQPLVLERNLFGDKVTAAFPSAIFDIEEAGKCLAFERATACVFHLMRVMEVGLKAMRTSLQLQPTSNRNWEDVLKKCDSELKKDAPGRVPEWKTAGEFFSEATANLRAVKNAWRNPTMHVENVYTEEQAEDIWNAVKGFMRHLATKLNE